MPELSTLKKRYAALLGRYPRGRCASDTKWLKREIKRMDQTLKMVVRGHITHANKRTNPMPKLIEEVKKYGLHPNEHELGRRAVRFYRSIQNPRRVKKKSAVSRGPKKKRNSVVTFAECRSDKDCAEGYTCSGQKVCVKFNLREIQ
jgi:hypothetical protein